MSAAASEIHQVHKAKRINVGLAIKLLTAGQTVERVAPQVGCASANALQVCLWRKGIKVKELRPQTLANVQVKALAARVVTAASEQLKGRFSDFLSNHVSQLQAVPARSNLKHLKAVGEAAEPFARIAKVVHGWGDTSALAVIQSGQMPEPDDCGVAATSPSGSIEVNSEVIPQEDEHQ